MILSKLKKIQKNAILLGKNQIFFMKMKKNEMQVFFFSVDYLFNI